MTKTIVDYVFEDLIKRIKSTNSDLNTLTAHSERAETCAGHPSGTRSTAPLAVNGAKAGDQYFITNGRKVGEGVGAGTGVLCYYNPATDQWFTPATDTAVNI